MAKNSLHLEVLRQGVRIQVARLDVAGISIGRDPANTVILRDPGISKRHAKLHLTEGNLILSDVGSVHGTFTKGQRIQQTTVAVGQIFEIGQYTLRVVDQVEPPPVSPQGEALPSRPTVPAAAPADEPLSEFRIRIQGLLSLTSVVGITDLQSVLETLLERTMALIRAHRGFIVMVRASTLSPIVTRQGDPPSRGEGFSRTVCQRALTTGESVVLTLGEDLDQVECIDSLRGQSSGLVMGIPLIDGKEALGVLYMECDVLLPSAVLTHLTLLKEISMLGGRALRAAMERQQIVHNSERWRWLANTAAVGPDLFHSCRSAAMRKVREMVERVGAEDITALILGESGTGKEVVARAIHNLSSRFEGPFVAVNCGAIPRELIEGELFGHEKGAFTGAIGRKLGRLEVAQGGTLLLDELGELPKDVQVKLLRVLETRTLERVGGHEPIHWDARVLAATNRNLERAMAAGEFREDLYYRLNVVSISLPPLRERREDIEPLVGEILMGANRRFRRRLYGVTPEALACLQAYNWPGNVRELRNVIERAFVLETNDRITLQNLPFGSPTSPKPVARPMEPVAQDPPPMLTLSEYVRNQETEYIRLVLDQSGGNVTRAARVLDLNRSALHKKMRALGIRGAGSAEEPEPSEE